MEDNKQLVEVIPVDNTPFSILKHDNIYMVSFAKYIISDKLNSKTECLELINSKDWLFMTNFMIALTKSVNTIDNNSKNN